jgi:hypothetical protein
MVHLDDCEQNPRRTQHGDCHRDKGEHFVLHILGPFSHS